MQKQKQKQKLNKNVLLFENLFMNNEWGGGWHVSIFHRWYFIQLYWEGGNRMGDGVGRWFLGKIKMYMFWEIDFNDKRLSLPFIAVHIYIYSIRLSLLQLKCLEL